MTIIFLRTIILYISVVIAMRVMGKRQIGELQPSELVITIMISELATLPVSEPNIPLLFGIIPIFTLVSLEIILSFLSLHSKKARLILSGEPNVIIRNGRINRKEMERIRLSSDDLTEELRQLNCTNINDVHLGIVETNGKLSLILKQDGTSQ